MNSDNRSPGQIFAMKNQFDYDYGSFQYILISQTNPKLNISARTFKNATLFCNNSTLCIQCCPFQVFDQNAFLCYYKAILERHEFSSVHFWLRDFVETKKKTFVNLFQCAEVRDDTLNRKDDEQLLLTCMVKSIMLQIFMRALSLRPLNERHCVAFISSIDSRCFLFNHQR